MPSNRVIQRSLTTGGNIAVQVVSSLTGLNSLALQNAKVCLLESNPVNDIECSLVYSDKSELSCNNGTNLRCDWLKSLPIESLISKPV